MSRAAGPPPAWAVGHRGGRAWAPENSLAAMAFARAAGVRAVEVDVRLSRDGQLVCSHDPSPRRLGGPARLVADLTADELGALRLEGGVGVPRLDEVLDVLAGRVGVVVEVKNDPTQPDFHADRRTAREVVALLDRRRAAGRVDDIRNVSSFDHESASAVAGRAPTLAPVVALLARWSASAATTVEEADRRGLHHVHLPVSAVVRDPGIVARAARQAVAVSCWTVNGVVLARWLRRHGVHAIITDDPLRMASA